MKNDERFCAVLVLRTIFCIIIFALAFTAHIVTRNKEEAIATLHTAPVTFEWFYSEVVMLEGQKAAAKSREEILAVNERIRTYNDTVRANAKLFALTCDLPSRISFIEGGTHGN